MTSISHYHIVIWCAKYSLLVEINRYLVFSLVNLFFLVRMLESSIVDYVAGRPWMLLRRLMPLMCAVGNGRIVLLGVAIFIGLDSLQLVMMMVPVSAHWGSLVGSRIIN